MKIKNTILKYGCLLCCMLCGIACYGCDNAIDDRATEVVTQTDVTTTEETAIDEIEVTTEKVTTEIVEESVMGEVSLEDEELVSLLWAKMDERIYSGDCSVGVYDITLKTTATIDSHSMQAASLIKLYIAGAVYENIDRGVIMKTDNMDMLLSKMICESDNDAANSLTSILGDDDVVRGMQRVNDYCMQHEFNDTHMGRLLLAPNDQDDNFTSVTDVTSFLTQIYEGRLPGSSDMLSFMKEQQRTSKLPAGIPEHVNTANKTGELADVENDAMIVLSETKPYVICVMCQYLSSASEARSWMTGLSSTVYNYSIEDAGCEYNTVCD